MASVAEFNVPEFGTLELDYVSSKRPPKDASEIGAGSHKISNKQWMDNRQHTIYIFCIYIYICIYNKKQRYANIIIVIMLLLQLLLPLLLLLILLLHLLKKPAQGGPNYGVKIVIVIVIIIIIIMIHNPSIIALGRQGMSKARSIRASTIIIRQLSEHAGPCVG